MTPDSLKVLFDGLAVAIMFVWGLVTKYFPPLARIPNTLIPWLNVVGYILAKLWGGDPSPTTGLTQAGFFGNIAPDLLGVIIGGFTNSVWARQLYEGFGRGLLEQKLGWKKAVPR